MTLKRALVTTVMAIVLVGLGQPATAQTPELLTVEFYSPAVDRNMKYNILQPSDYATSNERYPVM